MSKYWVISGEEYKSKISIAGDILTLENGLIKRIVNVNQGTVSLSNPEQGREYLSENVSDVELTIDGNVIDFYKEAQFVKSEKISTIADVHYEPTKCATEKMPYPAKGEGIKLIYQGGNFEYHIIYEIFDNIPVICKRLHIINKSRKTVTINRYANDVLRINKENYSMFYGETSYNGGCALNSNRTLSVRYENGTLRMMFDVGPDADLKAGGTFTGLRSYELVHTAKYYEQKMIEVKQMYRHIAPWVLESPFIYHILSDNSFRIRKAMDEISEIGFDSLIQSFGSKVNLESRRDGYIKKHKNIYDYGKQKGLEVGGYTLAIVKDYRPVKGPECNVYADPKGKIMRCLATEWSTQYWKDILNFYDKTGANAIEIDGPYHFYQCEGGETHLHKGLSDSRYLQWKLSTEDVFKELRERNVYINTPDWMFLNGTNKTGIGYEEIAFSEPRKHQLISSRIYNYKGTFGKIPSMGWSFIPLSVYHGGGKAASFAPLGKNLFDYEWSVFQHVMSGVLPCFRGKRLFDDEKSKAMLKKWVAFYKKYKKVINGITVHFMPPVIDENNKGRTKDLDCILNVIPYGEVRGILAVFNQTDREIKKTIKVPLYYTNIVDVNEIPAPYKGSGITEVKNPVYGEYPPPYPVETEEEAEGTESQWYGRSQIVAHEEIEENIKTSIIGEAEFIKEEKVSEKVSVDSNADAELYVNLPPMSYTYYIIKKTI